MGGLGSKVKALDFDEILSYTTVKYVKIKDKKVGLIHHSLEFVIFLYIVLYTIIYEQRYLKSETPYGSIRSTIREPLEWTPAHTLPYCLQNQTKYENFTNYNCTYMRGSDVVYPPGQIDSIFVSTRVKDTFYTLPSNCTGDEDMFSLECAPPKTPSKTLRYYIAGIDDYTIYMEHAIFGRENQILVSNFECEGKLILRNTSKAKGSFEFHDPTRTGDILPIKSLLEAATVPSLDAPSGLGGSYRYDGVLLVAVVTYTNYVTRPSKFHYTYELFSIPKQDVVSMQPTEAVRDGLTMQRNWYGVRILFLVVGSIGAFDFPTLLTSLVSGLVLIKLATVAVDMMLLYILPDKRMYTKHKFELAKEQEEVAIERTPLVKGEKRYDGQINTPVVLADLK